MRHQNQRCATFRIEIEHQVDDLRAGQGIQVAGRFIGENQFGTRRKGAGQRHPLLFTARKMFRIMSQALCQPDPLQPEFGFLPGGINPGQFEWQHDVFQGIERRKQLEGLKDETQQTSTQYGTRILVERTQRLAIKHNLTAAGQIQSGKQSQQGGFA